MSRISSNIATYIGLLDRAISSMEKLSEGSPGYNEGNQLVKDIATAIKLIFIKRGLSNSDAENQVKFIINSIQLEYVPGPSFYEGCIYSFIH